MNKTKRGYEAPTSELLVVRFEQNIMSPLTQFNGNNYTELFDDSGDIDDL